MSDVHQQKIQYLVSTAKCRKLEALIDASLPPKGIVPIDALIASIDRAALKSCAWKKDASAPGGKKADYKQKICQQAELKRTAFRLWYHKNGVAHLARNSFAIEGVGTEFFETRAAAREAVSDSDADVVPQRHKRHRQCKHAKKPAATTAKGKSDKAKRAGQSTQRSAKRAKRTKQSTPAHALDRAPRFETAETQGDAAQQQAEITALVKSCIVPPGDGSALQVVGQQDAAGCRSSWWVPRTRRGPSTRP